MVVASQAWFFIDLQRSYSCERRKLMQHTFRLVLCFICALFFEPHFNECMTQFFHMFSSGLFAGDILCKGKDALNPMSSTLAHGCNMTRPGGKKNLPINCTVMIRVHFVSDPAVVDYTLSPFISVQQVCMDALSLTFFCTMIIVFLNGIKERINPSKC
jgi:hypothetical protein